MERKKKQFWRRSIVEVLTRCQDGNGYEEYGLTGIHSLEEVSYKGRKIYADRSKTFENTVMTDFIDLSAYPTNRNFFIISLTHESRDPSRMLDEVFVRD
jgi:hypothetical protein